MRPATEHPLPSPQGRQGAGGLFLPCAPPLKPPLTRHPLRKEPCNHRSDTTWFCVLKEVVPALTRRDILANAPGRAQDSPLLIA